MTWKFWTWFAAPPPAKPDDGKTEDELAELEDMLRFSIKALLRKSKFLEKESKLVLKEDKDGKPLETQEVFHEEDKLAFLNAGVDAIASDYTEYFRVRVKPNPKKSDGHRK